MPQRWLPVSAMPRGCQPGVDGLEVLALGIDREHGAVIAALYEAASRLPEQEREAYLTRHSPDSATCEAVRRLIEATEDDRTFFQHTIEVGEMPPVGGGASLNGVRLGAWRVRYPIAEGGMGSVWLAERADSQFEQQVAVKVVHPHLDCPEIRERFEWERRIQARLEHPHIGRILDAGSTPDGRPYLVTPFIEQARPLTGYCRYHRLGFAQRIALFRQVAAAVGFAHRNLVVHSDIKPGNILVGKNGQVQLVDFGIARLMTAGEDHETDRRLTPAYAAPEQFAGEPPTTVSDVYSLGVLLERLVEDVPIRRVERADTAAIISRATATDPDQRYRSVEALDQDLERMLNRLPVQARRQTAAYRVGRFIRRNRWPVAGALALACGLLAVVVLMAVMNTRVAEQARRAEAERDRAEATAAFWADLFQDTNPIRAQERVRDIDELLARAVERLTDDDQLSIDTRARLLGEISTAYWNLADYPQAREAAAQAVALFEGGRGSKRIRALAHAQLANVELALGETAAARKAMDQALAAVPSGELSLSEKAMVLSSEAMILDSEGRAREAARLMEETIAMRDQLPLDDVIVDQATNWGNLGYLYFHIAGGSEDREIWLDRAEASVARSLELTEQHFGPDHPRTAYMHDAAGVLSRTRGELSGALAHFQRAETIVREHLPPGHGLRATVGLHLASTHQQLGDHEAARLAFAAALESVSAGLPADHPDYRAALLGLARAEIASGRLEAARATLRRAAEYWTDVELTDSERLWLDVFGYQARQEPGSAAPDDYAALVERANRIADQALIDYLRQGEPSPAMAP